MNNPPEGRLYDFCPGCGVAHGERSGDELERATGYCRKCRDSLADNDADEQAEDLAEETDEQRARQLLRRGLLWAIVAAVALLALAAFTRS